MQKKFEILFFPRFEYPGNGSGLQLKFHGIQCGIHRVCLIGEFPDKDGGLAAIFRSDAETGVEIHREINFFVVVPLERYLEIFLCHRNDHFVPSFFPEIHGDSPLKHLFSGINKPNAEFIDNGRRFIFQFKCTECITELW